jgi:hypothetical protein
MSPAGSYPMIPRARSLTLKFIVFMTIKGLVTTGGAYLGISGILNDAPAPTTVGTVAKPSSQSNHSAGIPTTITLSGS